MNLPRASNRVRAAWRRPALALAVLLLAALPRAAAVAQPAFPDLSGRVVDEAGVLDTLAAVDLEKDLAALEQKTSAQLVVATVKSLQGYEIRDYGYQLGRHWGIGQEKRDNGVVLLVAPNERKVAIEVGYGLEGTLTDALARTIIDTAILPKFRSGDLAGGITAGVAAIRAVIEGDPEQVAQLERAAAGGGSDEGVPIDPFTIVLLFIVIMIIFSVLNGGGRGRRRRGGVLPVPIGGMGGGSRGGGFGGGGFSGGGGGFGGGGASGGW